MDIREAQTKVKQELAKHHDIMILFLRDIVAIPSFDSQIDAVGYAIGARMTELGFDDVRRDSVVIGESTTMEIYRGHRWRIEVSVTFKGIACYTSAPERGDNALYKAFRF